jgi:hypothetical protein
MIFKINTNNLADHRESLIGCYTDKANHLQIIKRDSLYGMIVEKKLKEMRKDHNR